MAAAAVAGGGDPGQRPFSRVHVYAAAAAPLLHCVGYADDGACGLISIERHDG